MLAGLGKVAAAEKSYERAACLFGAAERTREDDPTRQFLLRWLLTNTATTTTSISCVQRSAKARSPAHSPAAEPCPLRPPSPTPSKAIPPSNTSERITAPEGRVTARRQPHVVRRRLPPTAERCPDLPIDPPALAGREWESHHLAARIRTGMLRGPVQFLLRWLLTNTATTTTSISCVQRSAKARSPAHSPAAEPCPLRPPSPTPSKAIPPSNTSERITAPEGRVTARRQPDVVRRRLPPTAERCPDLPIDPPALAGREWESHHLAARIRTGMLRGPRTCPADHMTARGR